MIFKCAARNRLFLSAILGCLMLSFAVRAELTSREKSPAVPPFPVVEKSQWLNAEPLSWPALQGKVVLLNYWTFACWNCTRSFPWLTGLEQQLADQPFQVVGVHSPEFAYEKQRERLLAKVARYQLTHPILVDNNHHYWQAIGNQYWPAFYLIGKQGRIRSLYVGEMHAGSVTAKALEADIQQLLLE